MRSFKRFLLALCLLGTGTARAKIDLQYLSELDKPLRYFLVNSRDKEEILRHLEPHLGRQPTLRQVIHMSPSKIYKGRVLRPSFHVSIPRWGFSLQQWMAVRGFSVGMTEQDLAEIVLNPDSVKYRTLLKVGLSSKDVPVFENLGLFTVFDLFRRFPSVAEVDAFVDRVVTGSEPGTRRLFPPKAAQVRLNYRRIREEYLAENVALSEMNKEFRASLSEPLALALAARHISSIESLSRISNEQLVKLLGYDLKLISELYSVMNQAGIYDDPIRCSAMFQKED